MEANKTYEAETKTITPRGPDTRPRLKLRRTQLYSFMKWLEVNTKRILDERPSRILVAEQAGKALGLAISEYHVRESINVVIPDYKPLPKKAAATVQEDHRVAMRILSSTLLDLLTKMGEKQPPALLALYDRYRPTQGPTKANSILPSPNGTPPSVS